MTSFDDLSDEEKQEAAAALERERRRLRSAADKRQSRKRAADERVDAARRLHDAQTARLADELGALAGKTIAAVTLDVPAFEEVAARRAHYYRSDTHLRSLTVSFTDGRHLTLRPLDHALDYELD